MKVYRVGGAVRDELLGLPVKDQDYVVVGATPEELVKLGFKPVGKDFPVFLHPETREEYALARTERKTGRGYKSFTVYSAPDVTLEQDLARRDLTINAIARDQQGNLIDPFNGVNDLKAGLLRHVSPAFTEDPVRLLRVARFAARYDFNVAAETQQLMMEMVKNGEVNALVAERVWQELAKGLMEAHPSHMFQVLKQCGALSIILPEIDRLFGVPQPAQYHPEIDTGVHIMLVIDFAAQKKFNLAVRFAALVHDLGKGTTPSNEWPSHHGHEERSVKLVKDLVQRLKIPRDCGDLALLVARFHGDVHRALELRETTIVKLLESVDAFRRSERFRDFIDACRCDFHGRTGYEDKPYPQANYLIRALELLQTLNLADIAKTETEPQKIAARIHETRVKIIREKLTR